MENPNQNLGFIQRMRLHSIRFYNRFIAGRTTIFKQLILNVVIPAVLALLILGFFNYQQTKKNLISAITTKKEIISAEITKIMEFQDVALEILEENLDKKMEKYSQILVEEVFEDTRNIEYVDLNKIRRELGMDEDMEDIYIINKDGFVVNTTFEADLGLNFFEFGEDHKKMLLDVFVNKTYFSERFAIPANTKRLKKYTYQATIDGNYIVEIGIYSSRADEITNFISNTLNEISQDQPTIQEVDLFLSKDNPFSLNRNMVISDDEKQLLIDRFENQDSLEISYRKRDRKLHFTYMYMHRENSHLYKGAVVRIIADRSSEVTLLRNELLKFLIVFGATICVVITMLYRKTRVITHPIKTLVDKVNRITDGHFNERAEVIGNNEIATLSKKFNSMIAELESYYNELEQKVKERTAEVVRQKEEIEIKNKHIMDSIVYAKRIQTAILPPDSYVQELLPDSFILYKPKDIVSGDFYWMTKKRDKVMYAAVDCTGHGVPGAFMSIVGYHQLNNAVEVRKARNSKDILDYLNEGVIESLHEKGRGSKTNVRDGMDLALCVLDYKSMKVQFSGAHNPLYIVRGGELIQLQADRHPIGGNISEKVHKFEMHEMDLKKGDVLYTFSDGYPDQFGGRDGRKFLKKRFRELLVSIHADPMDAQKEVLDQILEEWRGDEEQIDDILVIGVRI